MSVLRDKKNHILRQQIIFEKYLFVVNKRTFNQTISIASSLLHLRFKRNKKTLLGILKTKSWKLHFFIYLKKKYLKNCSHSSAMESL